MNSSILKLIKTVSTHSSHVDELETLARVLEDAYPEESVVAKTTFNSRYHYRCLGHRRYQHPENHIDTFFNGSGLDHPLVTADNDHEIYYSRHAVNQQEQEDDMEGEREFMRAEAQNRDLSEDEQIIYGL